MPQHGGAPRDRALSLAPRVRARIPHQRADVRRRPAHLRGPPVARRAPAAPADRRLDRPPDDPTTASELWLRVGGTAPRALLLELAQQLRTANDRFLALGDDALAFGEQHRRL